MSKKRKEDVFVDIGEGYRIHVDALNDPELIDEDPEVLSLFSSLMYEFDGGPIAPLSTNEMITLDEPGPPNPAYDRAHFLLEQQPVWAELVQGIKDLGMQHTKEGHSYKNEVDITAVAEAAEKQGLKDKFVKLWEQFESIPDTEPRMPPHPNPANLYTRFEEDTPIYDIGIGNGEKLEKFATHLDIKGCEPGETETDCDNKPFGEVEEEKIEGRILTSHNVLTQLTEGEFERVAEHDGIHIFPDVQQLQEMGVAKEQPDGSFKSKDRKGVEWVDRKIDIDHKARVSTGFAGTNFYAKRKVRTKLVEKWKEDVSFQTYTAPGTTITADAGFKIDGVQVMITITNGVYEKLYRNGACEGGECNIVGKPAYVQFLAEEVGSPPFWYMPTRVLNVNGMVPYHSGTELVNFAKRFDIKINGIPVVGPVKYDQHLLNFEGDKTWINIKIGGKIRQVNVDGIIFRGPQFDHYDKHEWTFDTEDLGKVIDWLEDNNLPFIVEDWGPPNGTGVREYKVTKSQFEGYRIRFHRERGDKAKGNEMGMIKTVFRFVDGSASLQDNDA